MKNTIEQARKNCAATLSHHCNNFRLLADMLFDKGQYQAYWQDEDGTVLETSCEDIFCEQAFICIYQLKYVQQQY